MKTIQYFILILFTLYVHAANAQNDSILYSFFVAGHTYGTPGIKSKGLYLPFKQKFNYLQSRTEIKFGFLTGDIVSSEPKAEDWDKVDADISTLGLPVYFAVGNHDMENRELFENRYGATYYYFIFKNDLFLVLDPNIDSWNISGKQLMFVKTAINNKSSKVNNVYVFFHQMLWWEQNSIYKDYRPNSFEGRADTINFWTEVEPVFSEIDNPVYMFAGDFGAGSWSADFMYDKYSNISLIGSGMGEGPGDNFVITNVHFDRSVSYDLVCLNDSVNECFGKLTDFQLSTSLVTYNKKQNDVIIYPNPARLDFTVKITSISSGEFKFSLYDIFGVNIFNNIIEANTSCKIQHNLNSGIYFYSIERNGRKVKSGKLMIQN